jgi:hypothetical protein
MYFHDRVASRFRRILTTAALAAGAIATTTSRASAWVYPEHRRIAVIALAELDPDRQQVFESLWAAARRTHESRLCAKAVDEAQGEHPQCIDYAAWPAISGDHSCSSQDLVRTVLTSDWILDVAEITARLERRLAGAKGHDGVTNALRNSDIELQRSDPEYATRAGSNNVHFLLARRGVGMTPEGYAATVFSEGVPMNALAGYVWYHVEALEQARTLADTALSPDEQAKRALAVLADEAFALHFLEDVFAAGHVAGSWGDVALRKGTHDYYNEAGLAITTWRGERAVLTGDAWMRPEDAERAARSARKSLEQVIDAVRGVGPAAAIRVPKPLPPEPGRLNVCRTTTVPKRVHDAKPLLADVLLDTPVPMLASGLGEMPRFRAEIGPFIGLQAAASGAGVSGGFGKSQDHMGVSGGLELGARVGLGLDGVMNEAGDGLVFLDLGIRRDGHSTNSLDSASSAPVNGITAAIPARFGYAVRLRLPFWLLPMDFLIAGPILLVASPSTLQNMAVVAGSGGVIPWQAGMATPVGRFQFVLGREVGLGIYGYGHGGDAFIIPTGVVDGTRQYSLLSLSTLQLDLPVLEYRPFRSFSSDQSSNLLFQLFSAIDLPLKSSPIAPSNEPSPELRPVWYGGLRLSFDWRHYL